eukprot:TRINITY_DN2826_c0_g1_i1.p1 TRINITY_DN2826_c0_g1~~TRINITY_DN2826_c0_g1_i1.p1  ORF type:complete len:543 (+),score=170.45 TRINITY_DN2826_c0_g1_i1:82-1710(+)
MYAAAGLLLAAAAAACWLFRRRLWQVWCCCVLVARGHARRVGPVTLRRAQRKMPQAHRGIDCRLPAPQHIAAYGRLSGAASLLTCHGPCFGVSGQDIDVIAEPADFLSTLLNMIDSAQGTVHIAALYLGTSKMCQQVADRLEAALRRSPDLKVTLLLDYGRSLRRERDGTTALNTLAPVVAAFPQRAFVRLFMVPLCGASFRHAPPAIREFAGVQHIKMYVCDDDAMMSGANLNDDYFTTRLDRYIVFRKAPALSAWLRSLADTLAELSFDAVIAGDSSQLVPRWSDRGPHPVWSGPSPRTTHEFAEAARARVEALLKSEGDPLGESVKGTVDTHVWPMVQMAPLALEHDFGLLPSVLGAMPPDDYRFALASAYANFTPTVVRAVRDLPGPVRVIAPREEASGFYGAGGLKDWVPRVYTVFLRRFLQKAGPGVTLGGWYRKGGTVHAKGFWALPAAQQSQGAPAMTLVGSSNFGRRSEDLDLELQLAVLTTNADFIAGLRRELDGVEADAPEQTAADLEAVAGGLWRRTVSGGLASLCSPFL